MDLFSQVLRVVHAICTHSYNYLSLSNILMSMGEEGGDWESGTLLFISRVLHFSLSARGLERFISGRRGGK